jgi:Flp pilus assembly protein TadB
MAERRGNPVARWMVRAPLWQLYPYYAVLAGVVWFLMSRFLWSNGIGLLGAVVMGLVFGALNTFGMAMRRRRDQQVTGASEQQAMRLELGIQTRTEPQDQRAREAMRRLLAFRLPRAAKGRRNLLVVFGLIAVLTLAAGVLDASVQELVYAGLFIVIGVLTAWQAGVYARKLNWMRDRVEPSGD